MNVSATSSHLTAAMVTAKAAQTVDNDGDGRKGAAALNDGDAAARAAAHTVNAEHPAPSAAQAASAPASAPHAAPTRPGSVDVKV